MGRKKDLARTKRGAALTKAKSSFGRSDWRTLRSVYSDLLAAGARAEEDALRAAQAEAADLLIEAYKQIARARRLLVNAEVRARRAPPHAERWMTLFLPSTSLGVAAAALAQDTKRLGTQVRAAAESPLRLWGWAAADGPQLASLGPGPRRRRPSKAEVKPPLRSGQAGAYQARRALVRAVQAKARDVNGSPTAWALAGVALGLDEPCPHDDSGDIRWAALLDEWKKVLRRT
jgi:hypothetical protein